MIAIAFNVLVLYDVADFQHESPRSEATDDEMIWTISTVWLTDDEFNNLPEAD